MLLAYSAVPRLWVGTIVNSRTSLHTPEMATMTDTGLLMLPHGHLSMLLSAITCSVVAQDCLDSENIHRIMWLARSLHLNSIEKNSPHPQYGIPSDDALVFVHVIEQTNRCSSVVQSTKKSTNRKKWCSFEI
ncbi:hypothetical protein AVEN_106747-1 [Araneus ventricosus]|uniref:Uncharacterized protein n=1 Tax=Araneus ventricosus TaxID=182803 RepID=A0A4Y2F290_ARAVE|nr:hypothetical protein AVEN_106747-1 [Araneus ventricosus]